MGKKYEGYMEVLDALEIAYVDLWMAYGLYVVQNILHGPSTGCSVSYHMLTCICKQVIKKISQKKSYKKIVDHL
jgi:hypothetical protein